MKRLNSSDSLGGLISICPSTEDLNLESNHVYGRDYFDEEACVDECGQKKRRLSAAQVKALEKDFEVENKLEPDRKAKLAHDLGLQPRQVAVWFQNRRARWKTKQLERDYGVLKANFDALKCSHDSVQQENEALAKEIRELKSKLQEDNSGSSISVKEELIVSETEDQLMEQVSTKVHSISSPSESDPPKDDPNFNAYNNCVSVFKDGGTSSDSSAIMNNEESNSPNAAMSSSSLLHFKDVHATNSYQPQFVKIEEHNFFSGDETCNFFLEDQAPTLQWYCSEQWS